MELSIWAKSRNDVIGITSRILSIIGDKNFVLYWLSPSLYKNLDFKINRDAVNTDYGDVLYGNIITFEVQKPAKWIKLIDKADTPEKDVVFDFKFVV